MLGKLIRTCWPTLVGIVAGLAILFAFVGLPRLQRWAQTTARAGDGR